MSENGRFRQGTGQPLRGDHRRSVLMLPTLQGKPPKANSIYETTRVSRLEMVLTH